MHVPDISAILLWPAHATPGFFELALLRFSDDPTALYLISQFNIDD